MHQASSFRKSAFVVSLVLAFHALATVHVLAEEPDPSIELFHHILGPAMKTWSLRLEADGRVVEERHDWTSKRYLQVNTRCRLGKEDAQRLIDASEALVESLPISIGGEQGVSMDGPYKTLEVRSGAVSHYSKIYAPDNPNPSMEAQEFARAWETIDASLSCSHSR